MKKYLILLILLTFPLYAEAKNLYVNNSGSPVCSDDTTHANSTAAAPWCTIGRAAWGSTNRASPNTSEAAQAGDTVYIMAGTYVGTGTDHRYSPLYHPINSGTSNNRIVFEAVGEVILELSSGTGPMIGVSGLDTQIGGGDKNYVTFKGFTIYEENATGTTDSGLVMIAGGTGNIIEGCTLISDPNSPLEQNPHVPIWLNYDTGTIIRNNYIANSINGALGYHLNGAGIMFYRVTSAIIEHNEIVNCGSGVFLKGWENTSNTIRYNNIRDCGYGIVFGTFYGTHKAYQNIVRNSGRGISVHGLVADGQNGSVYIVNNTIVDGGVGSDESGGIHFNLGAGSGVLLGITVQNNIVYRGTGSTMVGLHAWTWDAWNITYPDRNVYYDITRWKKSSTNYTSLAAWQTALGGCPETGRECSSVTSDPLFVNVSANNYKLQSESPALTLGRTITAIHGTSGETIPAGAYITGSEVIGIDSNGGTPSISAPSGLRVVGGWSWQ